VALNVYEIPEFYVRMSKHGTYSDKSMWDIWYERNRMTRAFILNSGHSYTRICDENLAEFRAHPEYLAFRDGKKRVDGNNVKFCISNPGLRQLIVA
jgi:hypothetical protein